jgi:hypothetical protein
MFDGNYLPQALAMATSLKMFLPEAMIAGVFLGSDSTEIENLTCFDRVFSEKEIALEFPELELAKTSRSRVEFIFTLTPHVVEFAKRTLECSEVVYLDADLFFFSNPSKYLSPNTDHVACVVTPHSHLGRNKRLAKYGTFNVGWVGFNFNAGGQKVLDFWREACLEWCHDYADSGRYADQGYLDWFPNLGVKTWIVDDGSLNLGPWSRMTARISPGSDSPLVGDAPLVCYHFQGMQIRGRVFLPYLWSYRRVFSGNLKRLVYQPYLDFLSELGVLKFISQKRIRNTSGRLSVLDRVTPLVSVVLGQSLLILKNRR